MSNPINDGIVASIEKENDSASHFGMTFSNQENDGFGSTIEKENDSASPFGMTFSNQENDGFGSSAPLMTFSKVEYIKQLSDHEKKAYEIAMNHLGTSFNIYRSNGFIEWKKTKK